MDGESARGRGIPRGEGTLSDRLAALGRGTAAARHPSEIRVNAQGLDLHPVRRAEQLPIVVPVPRDPAAALGEGGDGSEIDPRDGDGVEPRVGQDVPPHWRIDGEEGVHAHVVIDRDERRQVGCGGEMQVGLPGLPSDSGPREDDGRPIRPGASGTGSWP